MNETLSIELKSSDEHTTLIALGIDWTCLNVFSKMPIEDFSITRLHIVIFNDTGDDDLYITEKEINDNVKSNSLQAIIEFIESQKDREITINKLEFKVSDMEVLFDDDAMLRVKSKQQRTIVTLANLITLFLLQEQ